MSRTNATSFLFSAVLLILAISTKVEWQVPEQYLSDKIKSTSVAADVSDVIAVQPRYVQDEVPPQIPPPYFLQSNAAAIYPQRVAGTSDPVSNAFVSWMGDLDDRTVFFEKNARRNWPIASLTKLMTAIIAKEYIGLQKIVPMNEAAIATAGVAGGFAAGEQYSASDLLRAMLVASSNDAAAALAEFYDTDRFVERMNEKAQAIGMMQTKFSDPTGLSPFNQSSAEDLRKLIAYVVQNDPDFFEITRNPAISIVNIKNGLSRQLSSTLKFAGRTDFLGGKTGYGEEGISNVIAVLSYRNHRILIIILGAANQEERFIEAESLLNWLKEAYIF